MLADGGVELRQRLRGQRFHRLAPPGERRQGGGESRRQGLADAVQLRADLAGEVGRVGKVA